MDALRGLAVMLMLAWHTAEGWVSPALHDGTGWRLLRAFAGLGAPLFVLLAGAAVALQVAGADRRGRPRGPVVRGLVGRGLSLVVLGYALRLQMWLLDSLAILERWTLPIWLPAAAGCAVALVGCNRLGRDGVKRSLPWLAGGAILFFGSVHQLADDAPSRYAMLLRPDVLHCIGVSIVVVTCTGYALGALDRPMRAALAGLVLFLLTDAVWRFTPNGLPGSVTDYVARTDASAARFPIFPWCGYAWLGLAVGTWWQRAADRDRLGRLVATLAVIGAAVAFTTSESLPHAYRWTNDAPWLVQPFRASFHAGAALVLAAVLFLFVRGASPLTDLGRASLVVYWVHLTFAFGIASVPLSGRLGYAAWAAGLVLLSFAMWAVARFRLGPYETWRSRAPSGGHLSGKRALL